MTRLARWSGRGPRKVPLATPALAELLAATFVRANRRGACPLVAGSVEAWAQGVASSP
jgi:hypothetical protein